MHIHFLRHATLVLTIHNHKLLVDPMLSPLEAMDPVPDSGNLRRNPMVPLPISDEELQQVLGNIDAVLVTHTHADHWDPSAQAILPKHVPILCQPEDQEKFEQAGFAEVHPVAERLAWRDLQIDRTGGQHGKGELGKRMAPTTDDEPTLYIAGDTVWCPEVEQALQQFSPEVVILNAGAPTFVTAGGPITMDADDVCQVARSIPGKKIVAVHMEAFNHCRLTRSALQTRLIEEKLENQVQIPQDGDTLTFAKMS